MDRRRSRRLTLSELRDMREAATRVPRRQLQIFLGLIDLQVERSAAYGERSRLLQLRCHIVTRMIVEKHFSLGHLPGRVKLEVVLADVCRCVSDAFRDQSAEKHLYWRLGPVDVDRDTALSMALLLSECLTECMSFASTQSRQRRIDVALNRQDVAEAELSIRDNCVQGTELGNVIMNVNPLPQRFAQRCGARLRINGAPNLTVNVRFGFQCEQPVA
jgi:two-component sensor histidine kinase